MANLEIKILPTRKKATGKLKIYISLTFKRQIRYIGTEFEIDDEAEIDNGRICYRKDAAIMNKRLSFILNEYKERLRRIDVRKFDSCSQLKDYLIRTEIVESLTIQNLFNRRILRFEKEGRKSYARMNRDSVKAITSILGNPPIDYLTRQDIKNLAREFHVRGYAKGNIQIRMTHFKAAINDAIDDNLSNMKTIHSKGTLCPKVIHVIWI